MTRMTHLERLIDESLRPVPPWNPARDHRAALIRRVVHLIYEVVRDTPIEEDEVA